MSHRARLPQSRRHVIIFDEDWEFLNSVYGAGSQSKLGPSAAIREIVHAKVKAIRDQVNQKLDQTKGAVATK